MGKLYEIVSRIHRKPATKGVMNNPELDDIILRIDEVIKLKKRLKEKSTEFFIKNKQIKRYPDCLFDKYADNMKNLVNPIKAHYEKKGFIVKSYYKYKLVDARGIEEIVLKISWE